MEYPFASPTRPHPGESSDDYRNRLKAQEADAQNRRQQDIAEQRSPVNTPTQRIRIWERRHQLPLPRRTDHPLLANIVDDTGLTLGQVHEEQQQRAAARLAAAPPAAPMKS